MEKSECYIASFPAEASRQKLKTNQTQAYYIDVSVYR